MPRLIRHRAETNEAFALRILREQGTLRAYDAIYNCEFEDGRHAGAANTRLAATVFNLRQKGVDISTEMESHLIQGRKRSLGVYRLVAPQKQAYCPVCGRVLDDQQPMLGEGWVQGRCLAHGKKLVKKR